MINVDLSPASLLGASLVLAGVILYQIRSSKPAISKDYDVVVSSVSVLVGGILIFQGWRLDPLLMFGQLLTAGVAITFAAEALKLRSAIADKEQEAELRPPQGMEGEFPSPSSSASNPFPTDPSAFFNDVSTRAGGRMNVNAAPSGPRGASYPPPPYPPSPYPPPYGGPVQGEWQGQGGALPPPREEQYVSNLWPQQQQSAPPFPPQDPYYQPSPYGPSDPNTNMPPPPPPPQFYSDQFSPQPFAQQEMPVGMPTAGGPAWDGAAGTGNGSANGSGASAQGQQRKGKGTGRSTTTYIDAVDDWE